MAISVFTNPTMEMFISARVTPLNVFIYTIQMMYIHPNEVIMAMFLHHPNCESDWQMRQNISSLRMMILLRRPTSLQPIIAHTQG